MGEGGQHFPVAPLPPRKLKPDHSALFWSYLLTSAGSGVVSSSVKRVSILRFSNWLEFIRKINIFKGKFCILTIDVEKSTSVSKNEILLLLAKLNYRDLT